MLIAASPNYSHIPGRLQALGGYATTDGPPTLIPTQLASIISQLRYE